MAYHKDLLKKYLETKGNTGWIAPSGEGVYKSFQFEFLMKLILDYLPPEDSLILDISLDPANFALKLAQINRRLIIADISESQIKIIREKFKKYDLLNQIEQFAILEDLIDLSVFSDNTFDLVISFAGTLSYSCKKRQIFLDELVRVAKEGAPIIFSVKTKAQILKKVIKDEQIDTLQDAAKQGIWEFLDTGYTQYNDLTKEPTYYAFSKLELEKMIKKANCEILTICALTPVSNNFVKQITTIKEDQDAWNNLLMIEKRISSEQGLIESGEEIIAIIRKRI